MSINDNALNCVKARIIFLLFPLKFEVKRTENSDIKPISACKFPCMIQVKILRLAHNTRCALMKLPKRNSFPLTQPVYTCMQWFFTYIL